MALPIRRNEDGALFIHPWELFQAIVAPKEYREEVESYIRTIKTTMNGLCRKCGACCRRKERINLHEFEGARIAYLLRTRKGIDAVLKHILHRPKPFNDYWKYILAFDDQCPFLENNCCSIYEDRPLICRLYPAFLEAYVDNRDATKPKDPLFSFSCQPKAPCVDDMKKVQKAVLDSGIIYSLRGYLWDLLEDRPFDLIALFCCPSLTSDSLGFVPMPDETDPDRLVAIINFQILEAYGKILGYPHLVFTDPSIMGAESLTEKDAVELATEESWGQAMKRSMAVYEQFITDYLHNVQKWLVEKGVIANDLEKF
ncbi:MAG: YkgJ family cysteine cluster protein [Candidatus Thorarchaeota archaeon]